MALKDPNEAAFVNYQQPHQCVSPTVNVKVNNTHAWIVVTSYSQSASDASVNATAGRSTFAFATFIRDFAYMPSRYLWTPSVPAGNPRVADMFANAGDLYLNQGSCAVGSLNAARFARPAGYEAVGDLTVAPAVTSAAVPARNTSVARAISTASIGRSTTRIWCRRASPMTVRRVMPSRNPSGRGVCNAPSITRKMFAPVVSATSPRQSSISASAHPSASAACLARVPIV
jgi:hypothetical protein